MADAPRSSQALIASDTDRRVEVLFHGTCSKCRHFHKGASFTFSLAPDVHTRMRCEVCGHDMFGFGGTDTQAALASRESIPLSQIGTISAWDRGCCSHRPIRMSTEEGNDAQRHNFIQGAGHSLQPESALGERHRRSNVAPETPAHHPISIAELLAPFKSSQAPHQFTPRQIQQLKALPYHQALLGPINYVVVFGDRWRDRFIEKVREYSAFGQRISIHPNHPSPSHAPGHDSAGRKSPLSPKVSDMSPLERTSAVAPGDANSTELNEIASHSLDMGPATTQSAQSCGLSQPNGPDHSTDNVSATTAPAMDTLAQFRREKTLRDCALQRLYRCGGSKNRRCPPHAEESSTDDHDDVVSRKTTAPSPLSTIDVPSHPLDRPFPAQRYLLMSHAGDRFDNEATSHRHETRTLSEASTVGDSSHVSSISLHPRRPALIGRSHSTPVFL